MYIIHSDYQSEVTKLKEIGQTKEIALQQKDAELQLKDTQLNNVQQQLQVIHVSYIIL